MLPFYMYFLGSGGMFLILELAEWHVFNDSKGNLTKKPREIAAVKREPHNVIVMHIKLLATASWENRLINVIENKRKRSTIVISK